MKISVTSKIFLGYLAVLAVIILFASCNSVKRVLKDPKKFDQVARQVVKSGYCINDTITSETIRDTTIYRDSIIQDTITAPCPDFTRKLASGIVVKSNGGVLSVIVPVKNQEKQKIIHTTNTVRDKRLEDILSEEKLMLQGKLLHADSIGTSLNNQLKESQKQLASSKNKIWVLYGLIIVGVGVFAVSKVKSLIP